MFICLYFFLNLEKAAQITMFQLLFWLLCRLNMSKVEKERFIVKFVESKRSNTEYAAKAYEVKTTVCSFLQNFSP